MESVTIKYEWIAVIIYIYEESRGQSCMIEAT